MGGLAGATVTLPIVCMVQDMLFMVWYKFMQGLIQVIICVFIIILGSISSVSIIMVSISMGEVHGCIRVHVGISWRC